MSMQGDANSLCYFFAEACRDGHVGACPYRTGDPWAETTEPGEGTPADSWALAGSDGTIMVLDGTRYVMTPGGWRPEKGWAE